MNKKIVIGMVLMMVTISVFAGCTDEKIVPSYGISERIGNHVHINYRYYDCNISTDFVTSSDCFWMFSITLTNKTRAEVVSTYYGYYDECNDQLYDNDFEKIDEIRWE